MELFINGVSSFKKKEKRKIADTKNGSIFIGAHRMGRRVIDMDKYFKGAMNGIRYYSRGLTDIEIACLSKGKTNCSPAKYYAKPYNTQGCNRVEEEIETLEDCRKAINELLQDSILGNSLNGGERFGKTIEDEQIEKDYTNVPSACSYREVDAQIVFNPHPNGRAHTSLAPICRRNPKTKTKLGCLPKCLSNGKWSVAAPTCEKDWCHPIFQEWNCCAQRTTEMKQNYYVEHHKQTDGKCPVNYGDCNLDSECNQENYNTAVCSQNRDLNKIDVCIVDLDPCTELGAVGPLCIVKDLGKKVGIDYNTIRDAGLVRTLFFGGSILTLGSIMGYYVCKNRKANEEYRALLEEEL